MKKLQFKCTLRSDVIINQRAATEGSQATLDFIPGNNFLGIAAGVLYKDTTVLSKEEQLMVFHSGKVRFGDAHPVLPESNLRSLKIPLIIAEPKMKNGTTYIIHHSQCPKGLQLQGMRNGFYVFDDKKGVKVEVEYSFAIKSAYDSKLRKSEDKKMYGYQSIDKGQVFLFEVEADDDISDELISKIKTALEGENKHIGRSRTAQYGLVAIEETVYREVETKETIEDGCIFVYADSRLIFLDVYGEPTFTPTVKQLGFEEGAICWEKSQIRTFQYAPWNFKRQTRDADRCGIEKGSVFAVKTNKPMSEPAYIGSYRNEGFGKVIYNPAFLEANPDGTTAWKIIPKKNDEDNDKNVCSAEMIQAALPMIENDVLLSHLIDKWKEEKVSARIYEKVNEYVRNHSGKFKGEQFASQWGTIRKIAMQHKNAKTLHDKLFGNEKENGYLVHGVAKEKWGERGRIRSLKDFMDDTKAEDMQLTLINLASAMAKECSNKKKGGTGND